MTRPGPSTNEKAGKIRAEKGGAASNQEERRLTQERSNESIMGNTNETERKK
jgi:hypothetical protein